MSRSRRRKVSRTRRLLESLLLVAGLAGIAVWIGSIVRTNVSQDWASWAFERKLHGQPVSVRQYLESWFGSRTASPPPIPKEPAIVPAPPEMPPAVQTGDVIGRLEIPRLKLHAVVREGAGARTLDVALGHIPGTAFPGQEGNVGVAGHRDSLFRGLGQIRKTDHIQLQTVRGNYEYEVESTGIVKPQQVSVLDAGRYPEITLVTCYPFHYVGSAPDRFIVKARLVEQPQSAAVVAVRSLQEPVKAPVERVKPALVSERRKPQSSERKVFFHLSEGHSLTLVPGISVGLERADVVGQRVNGWMWVMPDRRTIWVSSQRPREPLVFYGHQDGKRRELVITRIGRNSVTGYLQLFGG